MIEAWSPQDVYAAEAALGEVLAASAERGLAEAAHDPFVQHRYGELWLLLRPLALRRRLHQRRRPRRRFRRPGRRRS